MAATYAPCVTLLVLGMAGAALLNSIWQYVLTVGMQTQCAVFKHPSQMVAGSHSILPAQRRRTVDARWTVQY